MSKMLSLKAEFSAESKIFDTVRKVQAWYTSQKFSIPALIGLGVIDLFGFWQIAEATMNEDMLSRLLIVAAFVVAFELAPLYIGYAICLKSYKLGKPVHKVVFWLSLAAFIIGIVGNGEYRFLTMYTAYPVEQVGEGAKELPEVALPMTILMFLLPMMTSLVNIVIGCLSFDPLLFDLLRLSKKMHKLRILKRHYASCIAEMSDEDNLKQSCIEDEEKSYENAKAALVATRTRLRNYVQARVSSAYRN